MFAKARLNAQALYGILCCIQCAVYSDETDTLLSAGKQMQMLNY
jgi:hypothetical protein